MTLIKPTGTADAKPAADDATWVMDVVGATDSPFHGSGITAAILDTSIDPEYPAFAGVDLVQRNFTKEEDDDGNGHDTHIAGTVFGQDADGFRINFARGV